MASLVSRVLKSLSPPQVEKRSDALRFGILGAAKSAPLHLPVPAKGHPEVIVQAIAARDRKKAEAFAKKHGIPEVKDSYQDIIDDPNIDCILIPLPNGLHFEWTVRALRAGKHVLLEKPSVSNGAEAAVLFTLPETQRFDQPVVLLEAMHFRFHPAWQLFRSLVTPRDVVRVETFSMLPWWAVSKDHVHFNYDLAGGTMLGMGTYNFAVLRMIFEAEPEACVSCETKDFMEGVHHDCDYHFETEFRFPGGVGTAISTLQGPTVWKPSYAKVKHRQVTVPDLSLPEWQEKLVTREVTIHGWIHAIMWHRIDVKERYEIRSNKDGRVVKKWTVKRSYKAYTFEEAAEANPGAGFEGRPGEEHWMSFRYQLEEFVNRIKGRTTTEWVDPEDSILQMKMVDMAYEKSRLGVRPTGNYYKVALEP